MKRWKVLGLAILIMSMPVVAHAQEQKPFAQRECEREISMKKKLYTKALEEEDISEELFLEVTDFLEKKEAVLTAENSTEEYGLFPTQYIETLYHYQDSRLEDLAVFQKNQIPILQSIIKICNISRKNSWYMVLKVNWKLMRVSFQS